MMGMNGCSYLDSFVFGASVDGDAGPIVLEESVFHSALFDDGHFERF